MRRPWATNKPMCTLSRCLQHSQGARINITPSLFDTLFANKIVDPANAPHSLPPSPHTGPSARSSLVRVGPSLRHQRFDIARGWSLSTADRGDECCGHPRSSSVRRRRDGQDINRGIPACARPGGGGSKVRSRLCRPPFCVCVCKTCLFQSSLQRTSSCVANPLGSLA